MKTTVVNLRKDKYDVYIGRGSIWGNPFKIGKNCTREQSIERYKGYLYGKNELLAAIPELKNKVLGCYCKPLACHGDVLAELANK